MSPILFSYVLGKVEKYVENVRELWSQRNYIFVYGMTREGCLKRPNRYLTVFAVLSVCSWGQDLPGNNYLR